MTQALRGLCVAVTGASGFCGGHTALAAADRGATVVCLGRRPGPVGRHRAWDATRDLPDLAGADVVIHLAAAVGDPANDPVTEAAYRSVNVDGTARLLDAAGDRPVICVSSASVYGPADHAGPVGESSALHGHHTAYGRSKAAGDRLALDAGAVVLRPRAVYGPGDPYLLPRILRAVRAGLALLPGRDVRFSLTAVENLADACLSAIGWQAGAYNITDVRPYWRDRTVRAVLAAHGIRARVVHVPTGLAMAAARAARRVAAAPALTPYAVEQVARGVVLDITKATGQGWRPTRSLADYLARVAGIAGPGPGLGLGPEAGPGA